MCSIIMGLDLHYFFNESDPDQETKKCLELFVMNCTVKGMEEEESEYSREYNRQKGILKEAERDKDQELKAEERLARLEIANSRVIPHHRISHMKDFNLLLGFTSKFSAYDTLKDLYFHSYGLYKKYEEKCLDNYGKTEYKHENF